MKFLHTGLGASSEENADRFFVNILGLEKQVPKVLNKEITNAIFGISQDLQIINYKNENVHYEILVYEEYSVPERQISHTCLMLNDLENVIKKCRDAGLKVVEVPKKTGTVVFISDFDGNLFEVKEEK
jgi:catechol 2,3-dioxygenase-like lactoylglutathione lyase family enzyme